MSSSNPIFSCVVMTYNKPESLKACLESLARQNVGSSLFEVIVIDDGSKPGNSQVVAAFENKISIEYVYQSNRGVSAARNAGLKHARGQYVAFLADDYVLPGNYLEQARDFFNAYPDAQILTFNMRSCGGGLGPVVKQLFSELNLWRTIKDDYKTSRVIKSDYMPASRAAVFNKHLFERVGLFNEELRGAEDTNLAFRMACLKIPIYFLPKCCIDHWERMSFWELLRRRYEYGKYTRKARYQESIIESLQPFASANPRFFKRYFSWRPRFFLVFRGLWRTSIHIGKAPQFICLSPFIALFILSHHLGFCLSKSEDKVPRELPSEGHSLI
jgi:glycosyltransferase involved in cell wall biosynthesis